MPEHNLNELKIINHIKTIFSNMPLHEMEGISDDCAVIPISDSESLVITMDTLTENSHFITSMISAEDLGYKSLASNFSDVYAMGATPICSFLSLSLKNDLTHEWVESFMRGYYSLSERVTSPLLGGDTTTSSLATTISITAIGRVRNENIKRRRGASPGDIVAVCAPLGGSGTGLKLLLNKSNYYSDIEKEMIMLHTRPPLYGAESLFLGSERAVTSLMDISDGIAKDITHIMSCSHVGAKIFTHKIPTLQNMRYICKENTWDAVEIALCGGEEYAPLFTANKDLFKELNQRFYSKFNRNITPIGEILATDGILEWHDCGGKMDINYKGYIHK